MFVTRQQYEEWCKAANKRGIGGSHVAGLMGASNYSSPYKVWKECLYGRNEEEFSRRAKTGLELERWVALKFIENNPEFGLVEVAEGLYVSDEYPYMVAQIDYKITDGNNIYLLECKTTRESNLDHWKEGIPDYYYWQCINALLLTGLPKIYIACAIGFDEYRDYCLDTDDPQVVLDMSHLKKTVTNFWNTYITTGIAPKVDSSEATKTSIDALKSKVNDVGNIDAALEGLLVRIRQSEALIKEESDKVNELKNQVRAILPGFCKATSDNWTISYSRIDKQTFDSKRFKEEHPDLYQKYVKDDYYTRLDIRERKRNENNQEQS